MWPIVSIVLRYLSFSLAGPAFLPWPSAPVLTPRYRIILILRKYVVTYLRDLCRDMSMDMISLVCFHPRSLAVRASHHPYRFSTAGTVVTTVSCTYRTAHTRGSLRSSQHIHPAKPAAALAATVKISFSITDITRADTLMNPNIPAKRVRKRLPAKPMILANAFDTIDVIMSFFYLV